MKIKKILNNNAIITFDNNDNEIVAMGKGLAFNKKNGDEIEEEKVTKTYYLSNKDQMKDFEKLISNTPSEYIDLSMEIIQRAKEKYQQNLNDIIYLSLADHLYMMIRRIKEENIIITNPMLWDIKRFYKKEFELGIEAIDIISEKINVELPIDEAGFIALHFVEAQLDSSQPIVVKVTELIQSICDIVKYHFNIEYNENSVYYYRFITHLKFFAQRIFEGKKMNDNDVDLLNTIKNKYSEPYKCVEKIAEFLKYKYKYILTDEERLYLTIHIQRIVEELRHLV